MLGERIIQVFQFKYVFKIMFSNCAIWGVFPGHLLNVVLK